MGDHSVHVAATGFALSHARMRKLVRETAVVAAGVRPRIDVTFGMSSLSSPARNGRFILPESA